jgi:Na+/glutamate symporter
MSYLIIFGWISLGTFFGILVGGICAAGKRSDYETAKHINTSQEKIIKDMKEKHDKLQTKYDEVKTELHTYWMNDRDGGKYPIEGAD